MGSKGKVERELERCIDSVLEGMDAMYCADLTESAKVDARMNDIKLRDQLVEQIKCVVRCKKISERIMAEQNREVRYSMRLSVNGVGMSYTLGREQADCRP